jgi:hypothetical protein
MFFHISDQPQENYPCHWQLGGFHVSTDSGWQLAQFGTAQVLYKGYADRVELTDLLMDVYCKQLRISWAIFVPWLWWTTH